MIILLILANVMSWLICCGVVKLVTLCFGWAFSWAVATGIWLVIKLIKLIF